MPFIFLFFLLHFYLFFFWFSYCLLNSPCLHSLSNQLFHLKFNLILIETLETHYFFFPIHGLFSLVSRLSVRGRFQTIIGAAKTKNSIKKEFFLCRHYVFKLSLDECESKLLGEILVYIWKIGKLSVGPFVSTMANSIKSTSTIICL